MAIGQALHVGALQQTVIHTDHVDVKETGTADYIKTHLPFSESEDISGLYSGLAGSLGHAESVVTRLKCLASVVSSSSVMKAS